MQTLLYDLNSLIRTHCVSAPKNPTGEKYKIINFNPVYEKVKIYRESDYESSQGV
jgi:hypothetical protein